MTFPYVPCQLILPLGRKKPIRYFYLPFELLNLCRLFSHPFLKSGNLKNIG
jgi:hypothetical protein